MQKRIKCVKMRCIRLSGHSPFIGETEDDTYANIKHVRYDAHALYHNVTKFAMKFLYQTLKRSPKYVLVYLRIGVLCTVFEYLCIACWRTCVFAYRVLRIGMLA